MGTMVNGREVVDVPLIACRFNGQKDFTAKCHVGIATGLIIDCSLDDEPKIEMVVMAKDEAMVRRFFQHFNIDIDDRKFYEVVVGQQKDMHILKYDAPSVKPTPAAEGEDW